MTASRMTMKLSIFIVLFASASACAQYGPSPYTPVRWDENYFYLSDPAARTDWLDPIKYIPLNDDGDVYLSLGGQARYRYELWDNFNFGAGPQDGNGFGLWRFMAHADLHVGEHFRFFVQGKSALEDGRHGGPRPPDEDKLALQQAFGDFIIPFDDNRFTLRVGRQDLIYGAQRLISPLDWTNARRTFQGLKGSLEMPDRTLDLFLVQPVVIDADGWDEGDADTSFAGAYYVQSLPRFIGRKANSRWEAYALALEREPGGDALDSDRYTLGTRFKTAPKPWDVDVETAWQFGEAGDESIDAWMFAIEGGYTFADAPLSPRVFLGFDIASGGDDGERFDQLFPLGHAYFGYIDVVGRQNIIDLHGGATFTLRKDLTLRAAQHFFWRQDTNDALYNAAGAVQRADNGSDASYVGTELDLLLNWQIDRHWSAYSGVSHFWPGDFIDQTGPDEPITFFYAAVLFAF
ncbi:MAG: alginate export family protein [Tepidisphaeraceae bacterium]